MIKIEVIKETIVARLTTDCRSLSVIPCVIVRNTGMVPNGFVNVKKEVKQSKAKGNIVSIAVITLYVIFHRKSTTYSQILQYLHQLFQVFQKISRFKRKFGATGHIIKSMMHPYSIGPYHISLPTIAYHQ